MAFMPKLFIYAKSVIKEYKVNSLKKQAIAYYEVGDYINSYNCFFELKDKENIDKCSLKIEEQVLYEGLDYSFENVHIEYIKREFYQNIIDFLIYKEIPTSKEAETCLELIYYAKENEEFSKLDIDIIRSLKCFQEERKLFVTNPVKKHVDIAEYNIDNHELNNKQTIKLLDSSYFDNAKVRSDKYGIYLICEYYDVLTCQNIIERYYLKFGDYSDYLFLDSFDGEWFFYIKDNTLNRMTLDGKNETVGLAEYVDIDNSCIINDYLYDNDLLIVVVRNLDNFVFCRYYIYNHTKDYVKLDISQGMIIQFDLVDSSTIKVVHYDKVFNDFYLKCIKDLGYLIDCAKESGHNEYDETYLTTGSIQCIETIYKDYLNKTPLIEEEILKIK